MERLVIEVPEDLKYRIRLQSTVKNCTIKELLTQVLLSAFPAVPKPLLREKQK